MFVWFVLLDIGLFGLLYLVALWCMVNLLCGALFDCCLFVGDCVVWLTCLGCFGRFVTLVVITACCGFDDWCFIVFVFVVCLFVLIIFVCLWLVLFGLWLCVVVWLFVFGIVVILIVYRVWCVCVGCYLLLFFCLVCLFAYVDGCW